MPGQWENILSDAVSKFMEGIGDLKDLTVTTKFVVMAESKEADKPVPQTVTIIQLDGDYTDTVPMRQVKKEEGSAETELQIDKDLYRLHQQNVEKAIEYRNNFISMVMEGIKSLVG